MQSTNSIFVIYLSCDRCVTAEAVNVPNTAILGVHLCGAGYGCVVPDTGVPVIANAEKSEKIQ